jgi:hypothetical protein
MNQQARRSGVSWLAALVFMGLVGLSAVIALGVYLQLRDDSETPLPTLAVIADEPTRLVEQPLQSPVINPTLPPAWTPTPTAPTATRPPTQTLAPRPSETPFASLTPVMTLDPAEFGDAYWGGAGDGITMEYYYNNGRYRRFYHFPVTVYYDTSSLGEVPAVWDSAIDNALHELNQVVKVERADDPQIADIVLTVVSAETLAVECELSEVGVVAGCASIYLVSGSVRPDFRSAAFVSTEARNPAGAVLHELMHALGVVVHSPDPNDIMYYKETPVTQLSPRDLSTLRRLYASPSYGD